MMIRTRISYTMLAAFILVAVGCRPETKTPAAAPPDTSAAAANPQVLAKLAKADAYDGTVDKVVHHCAGCSLHMDGSEKHELTVGDYKMYFCSDRCLASFGKDAEKNILALAIPEEND